jgi:hypothetical protein
LYSLGDYDYGLGVTEAVLNAINTNPSYKTDEEKIAALLNYFLDAMPMASWERVAGALYYMEKEEALQAMKKFLKVSPDPTLTPENLSRVLDIHHPGL